MSDEERDSSTGGEPARELPPAGNGSLGRAEELPAAVPSAIFAAMHEAPAEPTDPTPPQPTRPADAEDAVPARLAILDVGPFAGLADLDGFQKRLSGLASVKALRLCQFADGRAEFEATLSDATAPFQRQVRERLPDALVSLTERGLKIDLGAAG